MRWRGRERELPRLPGGTVMLVNVSGRGDKDVDTCAACSRRETPGTAGRPRESIDGRIDGAL